jgi:hypothetical protein
MSESDEVLTPSEVEERARLGAELAQLDDSGNIFKKLESIFHYKDDMYFAMTRHAKVYLPRKKDCPLKFLQQIVRDHKLCFS